MAWKGSTARVYEYMIENIRKRSKIDMKRLKIFENFGRHEGSKTRRKLDADFTGFTDL
jgi:hypothetical protein